MAFNLSEENRKYLEGIVDYLKFAEAPIECRIDTGCNSFTPGTLEWCVYNGGIPSSPWSWCSEYCDGYYQCDSIAWQDDEEKAYHYIQFILQDVLDGKEINYELVHGSLNEPDEDLIIEILNKTNELIIRKDFKIKNKVLNDLIDCLSANHSRFDI